MDAPHVSEAPAETFDQGIFFQHLANPALGMPLRAFQTLDSTNQYLLDQAAKAASEGTLALAESQNAGRGRHRRLWHSPAGKNLYFSLLLWPKTPPVRLSQLAMVTALALYAAVLRQDPTLPLGLKWPNDLWLDSRKLSGILCECPAEKLNGTHGIVIGVGINVNALSEDFPRELQETATSLRIYTGRPFSREILLADFCDEFHSLYQRWLLSTNLAPFLPLWRKHDILLGKTITVDRPTDSPAGTVLGYTDQGLLLLQTPGETLVISAGDVHIRHDSLRQNS